MKIFFPIVLREKNSSSPVRLFFSKKEQITSLMASIFVTTLESSKIPKLKSGLLEQGFELSSPTPEHTLFQARKKNVCCTLYESLKLTVQGKGMQDFLEFFLEPEILEKTVHTYKNELILNEMDKRARIGVDESGKGDYFGPLCVAGVFADEKTFPILVKLGVCDSKLLHDRDIRKIAKEIVAAVPNYIIRLRPQKYNELYASFKNLNTLLGWCHTSIIEHLAKHTHPELAIIDKFAHSHVIEKALLKKKISLHVEQRVRGEQDIVVAAASIVARWAFIDGMDLLENEFHVTLPKGASSTVTHAAQKIVHEQGRETLEKLAKMHFVTTKKLVFS
jgi:ribonuclease HIII